MGMFDELEKRKSKEVDVLREDVGLFKNLIAERKQPLDLVRELLSNAAANEVAASRIEISYTKDREGHIFEIRDDGCGMNFTGSQATPGRLDRFLGLGLSAIAGRKSDEFSWKGLGSKLAYQSRRVEIETRFKDHEELYEVRVNEPWDTLDRGLIPKPRITEHEGSTEPHHTKIKVFGHPPHRLEEPFSLDEIRTFLLHRTFAGFTRDRANPPKIILSVMGNVVELPFGFPEFRGVEWPEGVRLDEDKQTLYVNLLPASPKKMRVCLKGFLTWDAEGHGLSKDSLNTGLIFSCKGIPYFALDMKDCGARAITQARPGETKTCLVAECDALNTAMNISRSDLVDCQETLTFKAVLGELFEKLETSQEYLKFRQIPQVEKQEAIGEALADEKRSIQADDQGWVVLERDGTAPIVLMREPKNETEVAALMWKLEALGALPFHHFQSLAYPGASKGPDLFVNFQEEKTSEPTTCCNFELERFFYNYKTHGHTPPQYPKVICWDAPSSGRKVRLNKTAKKHKFTVTMDECQVHVFVLRLIDGISVLTRAELRDRGITF